MARKSAFRLVAEPIVLAIALAVVVRTAFFRIYAIPSASMAPTLQAGDHIVVTPLRGDAPARGDVIVFRSPAQTDELMVKRVVGTPGDLVESRAGRVLIGGHALSEPYVAQAAASGAIEPLIVPSDCYFVMGDNRANSFDSRNWGVLPRDRVVGRVRMILWSSGDAGAQPVANASTRVDSLLGPRAPARFDRLFRRVR